MDQLPPLSHLQCAVLDALGSGLTMGRVLRENLSKRNVRKTRAAFYQLMSRLEEAGFVEGEYLQQKVGGVAIKERGYRITTKGCKALYSNVGYYQGLRAATTGEEIPALTTEASC